MAYTNYSTDVILTTITSGTSEQFAAYTLPETVNEVWILFAKFAENDPDNVLTIRMQAQIDSTWVDVSWDSITTTGALATAADTAANVTRTPNIVDGSSMAPTYAILAHYKELPSNVIRFIQISSGTAPTHTIQLTADWMDHQL